MLCSHRAAHATGTHPSMVTGGLAEPAGCRVLSYCPLVVLENVRPSWFPLLSRAVRGGGFLLFGTGQAFQEAIALALPGCCGVVGTVAKLESPWKAFCPIKQFLQDITFLF